MSTTGETVTGSATVQGRLWGARARDFTTLEPKLIALYESALDGLDIRTGTRLLDGGCGPGLFLRLAAQRGADVTGLDAAAPFIEIARERLPDAELTVGEMDSLPTPTTPSTWSRGSTRFSSPPNRRMLCARPGGWPGPALRS